MAACYLFPSGIATVNSISTVLDNINQNHLIADEASEIENPVTRGQHWADWCKRGNAKLKTTWLKIPSKFMNQATQIFQSNSKIRWRTFQWSGRLLLFTVLLMIPIVIITLRMGIEPHLPILNNSPASIQHFIHPTLPADLNEKEIKKYKQSWHRFSRMVFYWPCHRYSSCRDRHFSIGLNEKSQCQNNSTHK